MIDDCRPAWPYQTKPTKPKSPTVRKRRPRLTRADRLELLQAPWSLHFDREGTEDVAVIVDGQGDDLAFSRYFWRPLSTDPIPPTLAGMKLMATAPELLDALLALLDENGPLPRSQQQHAAVKHARKVIATALGEGKRP